MSYEPVHVLADVPPPEGAALPPPHDLEVEQEVIGAVLIWNGLYDEVASFLGPEHFYEGLHARIWETAGEMIRDGLPATPITIKHRFTDDVTLKEVGGPRYLARLALMAAPPILVKQYARIVFELAQKRRLIELSRQVTEEASDPTVQHADDIAARAMALIGSAATGDRRVRTQYGFSEAANLAAARISDAHRDGTKVPKHPTTGSRTLDYRLAGWQAGRFYVLAGRPGMGKSGVALSLLLRTARAGHGVLIFSMEMSRDEIMDRCLCDLAYEAGQPIEYERIGRNDLNLQEVERLAHAKMRVADLPFVVDDRSDLSLPQARAIAATVAQRMAAQGKRLDVIVFDHMDLVSAPPTNNKVAQVEEQSQEFKKLAKDLGLAVIGLKQLSRAVEGRDDKRPNIADLRWGGVEQAADVVLLLYREAYYLERIKNRSPDQDTLLADTRYELEVDVAKWRHGKLGVATLFFDVGCNAVRDLERR